MKQRVLLVSVNRETSPQPVYPLGLEYLRAACSEAGYETLLADCSTFTDLDQGLRDTLRQFEPRFTLVSIRNIDSIESADTRYYVPEALEVIRLIRDAADTNVILGGSGYSLFPRELLALSGADFGVQGPGEQVIAPLLQTVERGELPVKLPGAVYRAEAGVTLNPPRREPAPMRALPRSRELVEFYWNRGGLLNVQMKRGCPLHCIYCTYPGLEGPELHSRTPEACVDEIEALHRAYDVDQFFIVDNVFNLPNAAADAFAREVLRRGLKIKWTGYFSPRGVTCDNVRLWRDAGLSSIEFGIDAFSAQQLERYAKNFSVADVARAADACSAAGLPYSLFVIAGGPGETNDTLAETLQNCERLSGAVIFLLIGMRIYPGTPLQRIALQAGQISEDTSLLEPHFYISPELERSYLEQRADELASRNNWCIVGYGWERRKQLAGMLRKYGYKGSLWEQCITG